MFEARSITALAVTLIVGTGESLRSVATPELVFSADLVDVLRKGSAAQVGYVPARRPATVWNGLAWQSRSLADVGISPGHKASRGRAADPGARTSATRPSVESQEGAGVVLAVSAVDLLVFGLAAPGGLLPV